MTERTDSLIPYEQMLQAGMHFGRKRTVYSPRMAKYVFTIRNGICIIDLLKTQESIDAVNAYLKQALADQKLILFVAPTKQSQDEVLRMAQETNMPYVLDRWLGGTLTNFKILNARVKRLIELEEQKASGGWEKYTKKEQLLLERELADMKKKFEGLKRLTRMPDVVFVASLREGHLAVHEAKKMGVKVVAIANTDASPEGIEHVICANDRSKKSIDLILQTIRTHLTASR